MERLGSLTRLMDLPHAACGAWLRLPTLCERLRAACTLGKGLRLALDLGYDRCLDTAKVDEESGASPSMRELDARPVEWDGVLRALRLWTHFGSHSGHASCRGMSCRSSPAGRCVSVRTLSGDRCWNNVAP